MRRSMLLVSMLSAVSLIGCKAVDEEQDGEGNLTKDQDFYDSLAVDPFSVQPLALYSGDQLEVFLTNALYVETDLVEAPVDLFSTPDNVAILSDIMPQAADDGQHLFVISRKGRKYWPLAPWGFDILPVGQNDSEESVVSVDMDTSTFDVPEEFYWRGGWQLDVDEPYLFEPPDWRPGLFVGKEAGEAKSVAVLDYVPEKEIRVQAYSVDEVANPELSWTLQIDGDWKGAEQVGNVLYVWSQYTVDNVERLRAQSMIGQYENFAAALAALEKRQEDIAATPKDKASVMPSYTFNGVVAQLTEDCLLPSLTQEATAYRHLINVTAVNLLDGSIESTCLGGESNSFSVSADSVYVANSYSGAGYQTVIHKFDHSEAGLTYAATGNVSGILSRTSQIYATENDIRLVTANTSGTELYVLEQEGSLLNTVSSPISSQLNLAGNTVKADFFGDLVYISDASVDTFELNSINVVDVSDTRQPILTQTIDTSVYPDVFPLNDRYVFSWGFIYSEENGQDYNDGISVSLLTVNAENAGEVETIRVADGEPGGRHTMGVFSVNEDETRITFPVLLKNDQDEWIDGIQMMEVTGLSTGSAVMTNAGVLALEELQGSAYSSQVRVVGNQVTVFYADALWSAQWGDPDSLSAPDLLLSEPAEN